MEIINPTFERLKNKIHLYGTHLDWYGDLVVKGSLCVGGNLTVHGDLKAERIFCFGVLRVYGSISVGSLSAAGGVNCGGSIVATCGIDVDCYVQQEPENYYEEKTEKWIHVFSEYVRQELLHAGCALLTKQLINDDTFNGLTESVMQQRRDFDAPMLSYCNDLVIQCLGDLKCCHRIFIKGSIHVGGCFNPDDVEIRGNAELGSLHSEGDLYIGQDLNVLKSTEVDGDLHVVGAIDSTGSIRVWGDITAREISVRGYFQGSYVNELNIGASLECYGKIDVGEELSVIGNILSIGLIAAGTYIKAGGVIGSKATIQAGADYGIFSGQAVSRKLWVDHGYICCLKKPVNVLSGIYLKLSQKRPWKTKCFMS